MTPRSALLVLALAASPWMRAEGTSDDGYDFAHGRITHADPGVALQRPDEAGAEEAQRNVPFLPGDRLWSAESGRAEVQFADGSLLRLDRRSKLDYVELAGDRRGGLVVLSLWSGSAFLHVRQAREQLDFQVETPDGLVEIRAAGRYRVDVDRETILSVFEGEARIESAQRSVSALEGERSFTRRGHTPSRAEAFDAWDEADEFARWDAERGELRWQADNSRYLPEEVQPYAADLEAHGDWYYEHEVGQVWRPRVAAGWQPYSNGYWSWTWYGWTWVGYEPWGWAPFHYGRWCHSYARGWYWVPGTRWSPAWVSWRAGGDYVGWRPLGPGNRPAHAASRGHAVPRGQAPVAANNAAEPDGWFFTRRRDMGRGALGERRLSLAPAEAAQVRPLETRVRLTRDFRLAEASDVAIPRTLPRVKPSPGDSVPELRYDPLTTIPPPAYRRPVPQRRDDRRQAGPDERATAPAPTDRSTTSERSSAAEERAPTRLRTRPADDDGERKPAPVFERQTSRPRSEAPELGSEARQPRTRPNDSAERREDRPTRARPDTDVLRQFFQPLSGQQNRSRARDDDSRPARESTSSRTRETDRSRTHESPKSSRSPERAAPQRESGKSQATTKAPRQDRAVPRPPKDDR